MKDKGLYEIILLLPRDFKKSNSNNIKSRYIYYGPHTVKYFNQLSPLTSQQPYFMGEATKKERLNELLSRSSKLKLEKDWWGAETPKLWPGLRPLAGLALRHSAGKMSLQV